MTIRPSSQTMVQTPTLMLRLTLSPLNGALDRLEAIGLITKQEKIELLQNPQNSEAVLSLLSLIENRFSEGTLLEDDYTSFQEPLLKLLNSNLQTHFYLKNLLTLPFFSQDQKNSLQDILSDLETLPEEDLPYALADILVSVLEETINNLTEEDLPEFSALYEKGSTLLAKSLPKETNPEEFLEGYRSSMEELEKEVQKQTIYAEMLNAKVAERSEELITTLENSNQERVQSLVQNLIAQDEARQESAASLKAKIDPLRDRIKTVFTKVNENTDQMEALDLNLLTTNKKIATAQSRAVQTIKKVNTCI